MKPAKGYTLIELLAVVAILFTIIGISGGIFGSLAGEAPRVRRAIEANRQVSRMIDRLRADVAAARALSLTDAPPEAAEVRIDVADGLVLYERAKGKIIRRELDADGAERARRSWPVEWATLRFAVRREDGAPNALEVVTWFTRSAEGGNLRTLRNAHVLFVGPEGRAAP